MADYFQNDASFNCDLFIDETVKEAEINPNAMYNNIFVGILTIAALYFIIFRR